MHDILNLDRRGIPGCFIATEAFQPAAAAQGKALGFDPAVVWVSHPIQNCTPQELADIADNAIDAITDYITAPD